MRARSILLTAALAATLAAATSSHAHGAASATSPPDSQAQRAADLVFDAIGERRVVLLGEMHGTRETPALVAALLDLYAAKRHPVVLALEIGTEEQPRFDRYVASRGMKADRASLLEGAHWRDAHHDGRDSVAMFELIEHVRMLRERGAAVSLAAFDAGGPDMATRDRRMAEVLHATAKRYTTTAPLLVLTGNVHAMTRRPPWEMIDEGKRIELPMTTGRYLADLAPMSIAIQGASGAYWACVGGECKVQSVPVRQQLTQARLERNGADDAWEFTLRLPRFTPSPPAIAPDDGARAAGT